MTLEGRRIRLRAVEPKDAGILYAWENDPAIWEVSGTTEPYSREQIERFIERQLEGGDLLCTGQLRLMIEAPEAEERGWDERGQRERGRDESRDEDRDERSRKEARKEDIPAELAEEEARKEDIPTELTEEETRKEETSAAGENGIQEAGRSLLPYRTVGTVDLFEYDPLHGRAGLGILIYDTRDRRMGYARDTVETLCEYARKRLRMHQLWCCVGEGNTASLTLFRQLGFREVGIKRDWLWSPEGYRDEILLQKILD